MLMKDNYENLMSTASLFRSLLSNFPSDVSMSDPSQSPRGGKKFSQVSSQQDQAQTKTRKKSDNALEVSVIVWSSEVLELLHCPSR